LKLTLKLTHKAAVNEPIGKPDYTGNLFAKRAGRMLSPVRYITGDSKAINLLKPQRRVYGRVQMMALTSAHGTGLAYKQ